MKYLRKTWLRVLLSIISGAIISEIFHIKTGNSSIEISNTIVFLSSVVMFLLFSIIVWIDKYKYYFFSSKKNKQNDILDDFDG